MTGDVMVLNVRGGARICVPAVLNQITPYILLEQEDWFEDEIRFVRDVHSSSVLNTINYSFDA